MAYLGWKKILLLHFFVFASLLFTRPVSANTDPNDSNNVIILGAKSYMRLEYNTRWENVNRVGAEITFFPNRPVSAHVDMQLEAISHRYKITKLFATSDKLDPQLRSAHVNAVYKKFLVRAGRQSFFVRPSALFNPANFFITTDVFEREQNGFFDALFFKWQAAKQTKIVAFFIPERYSPARFFTRARTTINDFNISLNLGFNDRSRIISGDVETQFFTLITSSEFALVVDEDKVGTFSFATQIGHRVNEQLTFLFEYYLNGFGADAADKLDVTLSDPKFIRPYNHYSASRHTLGLRSKLRLSQNLVSDLIWIFSGADFDHAGQARIRWTQKSIALLLGVSLNNTFFDTKKNHLSGFEEIPTALFFSMQFVI